MTERPKPPIAANVDLRHWTGMYLDVVKLLNSDTWALADGWAAKAAMNLWCRSWHQVPAGSLPKDEAVLRKLADVPDWSSVRDVALRGFVECSDGRLYHPTVCETARAAWRTMKQKKTAANARWRKKKLDNAAADAPAMQPQSTRNADAMHRIEKNRIESKNPSGRAPGGAEPSLFAVQTEPPPTKPSPPSPDPPTPDAELYRRGREVLGKNCGGLVTDLKRHHGGNVALARATIEQASTKADPREYVGAVIRGRRDTQFPGGLPYDPGL